MRSLQGGHSNSSTEQVETMPRVKPRTKAPQGEQLGGELAGELAAYKKVGLFQHSLNRATAYRYRGVLLRYQKALRGNPPSLENSRPLSGAPKRKRI
jgi:hypothetical protein